MDCGEIISYQALLNKVLVRFDASNCYAIRTQGLAHDANAAVAVECAGKTLLELLWEAYDEATNAMRVVEVGAVDPYFTCDNAGIGIETALRSLFARDTNGDLAIKVNFVSFDGGAGTCMACDDNSTPIETLVKGFVLAALNGEASLGVAFLDATPVAFTCDNMPDFETAIAGTIGAGINIIIVA